MNEVSVLVATSQQLAAYGLAPAAAQMLPQYVPMGIDPLWQIVAQQQMMQMNQQFMHADILSE